VAFTFIQRSKTADSVIAEDDPVIAQNTTCFAEELDELLRTRVDVDVVLLQE